MSSSSRNYQKRSKDDRRKAKDRRKVDDRRVRRSDEDSEPGKSSEDDRPPAFYVCEPTKWTIADSEMTDPIYVRDTDMSHFVPLPQAESDYRPSTDPRIEEHFIGVRTSEEAGAIVKPDDFVLYYKREEDDDLDVAIPLYLAHRNTRNRLFHFPVVRYAEDNGSKWWHVQIGHNSKTQSFRSLSDLVRCYHLYRFTDARTGRMEVFPLWKGGILDDYQ
ncbi:unnamed protein product [Cylicocyclus nassatus]|uniref:Uncharacterized protein n=1 Tax=Cylicocyclus nassatus TaxID=53992 RepID=A0AA36M183_CYLNA|nr:unnamed protein product [Cylicocyclus nassatus]